VSADLICPFCGEADYDSPGLKNHIDFFCERYRLVDSSVCRPAFASPPTGDPTSEAVEAATRALCRHAAEVCGTDPNDEWTHCADTYKQEASLVLATGLPLSCWVCPETYALTLQAVRAEIEAKNVIADQLTQVVAERDALKAALIGLRKFPLWVSDEDGRAALDAEDAADTALTGTDKPALTGGEG
jgi:hypothetical protein